METLLSFLKSIPEYNLLTASIAGGESAAVTGIGQVNRSHIIAGLRQDTAAPMIILCQDDLAARRLQEELKCFLGQTFPVLPSRELTLYDTAVVSRGWEQKRLRLLYELVTGECTTIIMTWESMSQRTMTAQVLCDSAFTLKVGQSYNPVDECCIHVTRRQGI